MVCSDLFRAIESTEEAPYFMKSLKYFALAFGFLIFGSLWIPSKSLAGAGNSRALGLTEYTLSEILETPQDESDKRWFYFIYKGLVYDLGDFASDGKIPVSHRKILTDRKKKNPILTEDDLKFHPNHELKKYLSEEHVVGKLKQLD